MLENVLYMLIGAIISIVIVIIINAIRDHKNMRMVEDYYLDLDSVNIFFTDGNKVHYDDVIDTSVQPGWVVVNTIGATYAHKSADIKCIETVESEE